MTYRCEAKTVTGFVQQLACCYLVNGYHYYVIGEIPERKDPASIDRKMLERFGVDRSRFQRVRRKRAGQANVQYLRYGRFFVLLATEPHGAHRFFEEHSPKQVRHIRKSPIAFGGYSIGYHRGVDRKWHVSVRMHPTRYRDEKAYLLELATRRTTAQLAQEFEQMGVEPYAPVRRQLLALLRAVNQARAVAGLELVPVDALRLRRQIVRPFGRFGTPVGEQNLGCQSSAT